jgi:5,10-methylenetetrahydromethanopterin reductase
VRIGVGVEAKSIAGAIEGVRRAADAGFDSAWFSNTFGLDAITTSAVVTSQVPGIAVGTAVVPTFPRHPFAMAQQAATAHDASGGRFILGIGLSHQVVIESMWGMSFDKPVRHMREYLSVLMPLLRDGKVDFKGEVYSVQATLDRPSGSPPVLVAALGPTMLRLTGEFADGTLTWMVGVRTLAEHVVPTLTAATAAAGRPEPHVVAGVPVCVTDDRDAARERAASTFSVYGRLPSYRAMLDREGAAGPEDLAVVGDEKAVTEAVRAYADAGVTDLNAVVFGDRADRDRTYALLAELER